MRQGQHENLTVLFYLLSTELTSFDILKNGLFDRNFTWK